MGLGNNSPEPPEEERGEALVSDGRTLRRPSFPFEKVIERWSRGENEQGRGEEAPDEGIGQGIPDVRVGALAEENERQEAENGGSRGHEDGATRSRVPVSIASSNPTPPSLRIWLMWSTKRMALFTTIPPIMITPIYASRVKVALV